VKADAKSVMGVLMLVAGKGSRLTVRSRGADAEAALGAICALFERSS
jgi:phosphotransferase system HPr (HPr) family protein